MIFHRVDPPDAVPPRRSFAGIFSNTTQFHSSGFLQLPRRVENRLDNLPIPHSAEQLSIPRGSLPRSAWGFAEKILDEHEMPAVQKPHWRRSSRASHAGEFSIDRFPTVSTWPVGLTEHEVITVRPV